MSGLCPECEKTLEVKQISMDSAILICPDLQCPYPVRGDAIVIKRSINDMNKPLNKSDELDRLLNSQKSKPSTDETNTESATEKLLSQLDELLKAGPGSEPEQSLDFDIDLLL